MCWCLLFVGCCWLVAVVCCSVCAARCALFAACCPLCLADGGSLTVVACVIVACWLLLVEDSLVFVFVGVVCCVLSVACRVMFATDCWLQCVVCCCVLRGVCCELCVAVVRCLLLLLNIVRRWSLLFVVCWSLVVVG